MMMNAEEQGMPTRLVEWTDNSDQALLTLIRTPGCSFLPVIRLMIIRLLNLLIHPLM
ncbi:hypothetical protein JCM19235_4676 [Vibrio maritimus]|uniref:Uncharacterized protein n=1 Tax=Vibrio maritimus TaxID=990268 RepID=A0A090S7D5_9VIBR|nr:hypothetical protein JCM19235_4676 [Vibrio maritimus]